MAVAGAISKFSGCRGRFGGKFSYDLRNIAVRWLCECSVGRAASSMLKALVGAKLWSGAASLSRGLPFSNTA